MSRNYVYAVALTHPFTIDPVPLEAYERVCVELPNIVHTLFAINRDTTRGYWLDGILFVRTTDPIFYAYQAQRFLIQFLNGTTLFSYRIQFERRPLPARIPPRRLSFFELMPWERDGPPLHRESDRGPALPSLPSLASLPSLPLLPLLPSLPPLPLLQALPAGSSAACSTSVGPTSTAQRPGTPRPMEVPSIEDHVSRLESLPLELSDSPEADGKNERDRPTLRCPG